MNVIIPTTKIGKKTWILLNVISDSFTFRGVDITKPIRCKDPSDHRLMECKVTGSVKCSVNKEWDISNYTNIS